MTEAQPTRPVPLPDAHSQHFWESLTEGVLTLPSCTSCKQLHYPPQGHCPHCGAGELQQRDLSGRGTVYSWTTLVLPPGPGFQDRVPCNVSVIELDEQEGLFLVAEVLATGNVAVGARVTLFPEPLTPTVTLPRFQVVESE